jgi:hypothetical protein
MLEHHRLADPARPDEHDGPAHVGLAHQARKLGEVGAPRPLRFFGVDTLAGFPPRVVQRKTALDLVRWDLQVGRHWVGVDSSNCHVKPYEMRLTVRITVLPWATTT